jgi:hypothetical protein
VELCPIFLIKMAQKENLSLQKTKLLLRSEANKQRDSREMNIL